ncbi:hypothetical protein F5Y04DRAFT_91233 [Hypomontagnella monticulosa]|nr:hypothetical protein F5Y04DRAFT_91233 [Hypomontagnella monticulosa]
MAEAVGAVASIIGIAEFGLKFATTLQTYIETVVDARESWREITFDVSATASALEQLHRFTKPGENGKAIANESGLEQVTRLALQCRQVYTAIIDLIAKAAGIPRDDNGDVSMDELDLDSLNSGSLMRRLIWPFQEHRVKKHREELRWLKISLLFHLRLMELAKTKMNPARSLNAWEKELALQATLERLLERREAYARQIAAERRKSKTKGKRRRSLSRASSISTIEKVRSRSPRVRRPRSRNSSFERRSPIYESPKSGDRELSFSPVEDNNENAVMNAATSHEPIDDVLTYMPNNFKPKPSRINTNSPPNQVMAYFAGDLPDPVVESPFARPIEDNGDNADDSKPKGDIDNPVDEERPFRRSGSLSPGSSANASIAPPPPPAAAMNITSTQTDPGNLTILNNPYIDPTLVPSNPPNPAPSDDEKSNPPSLPTPIPTEPPATKLKPKPPRRPLSILSLSRFSNLFRRRSRAMRLDWEGQELEAYLIEGDDSDTIRKLPFNHQQLVDVLRSISRSSRAGDVWTQYASLTSSQRASVDRAMLEANRTSARARTFLTISLNESSTGDSNIVVFFALGPPVPPVHLRLRDRNYKFTFELCRTWEGMVELMKQALNDAEFTCIQERRFRLWDLTYNILLPETWSANVRPGFHVFLDLALGPPRPLLPPALGRRPSIIRIPAPQPVQVYPEDLAEGTESVVSWGVPTTTKKAKKKKKGKRAAQMEVEESSSSDGLMAVRTGVRRAERDTYEATSPRPASARIVEVEEVAYPGPGNEEVSSPSSHARQSRRSWSGIRYAEEEVRIVPEWERERERVRREASRGPKHELEQRLRGEKIMQDRAMREDGEGRREEEFRKQAEAHAKAKWEEEKARERELEEERKMREEKIRVEAVAKERARAEREREREVSRERRYANVERDEDWNLESGARRFEREGRVLESARIPETRARGFSAGSGSFGEDADEDKDEDEGIDIIDFEEEQETAGLGLGSLLGKWTNAFDHAPNGNEEH